MRVLGCSGGGFTSDIILGLEYAADDTATNKVVVMSLGGGFSEALNSAVQAVHDAGVTVVVAAGNEQADACFTSPASASAAITVAASNINDTLADFSNFGPCVDITAPGVDIISAKMGATDGSVSLSGTSVRAAAARLPCRARSGAPAGSRRATHRNSAC